MEPSKIKISLTLNGAPVTREVFPNQTLLELLRNDLGLMGTKEGCGEGECGACTVLLNKKPVYSCILPAFMADGREVETVEGMGNENNLHPLQQSFIDHGAVQCGFCTPAMLLTGKAALEEKTPISREEIKTAISGNLCRCTGYNAIIEAIEAVAKENEI